MFAVGSIIFLALAFLINKPHTNINNQYLRPTFLQMRQRHKIHEK